MDYAIILAAGKGTRMRTELPQCAFPLIRKPMVAYVVENVLNSEFEKIIAVVGYKKELIKDILGENVLYAVRRTAWNRDAVLAAESLVEI